MPLPKKSRKLLWLLISFLFLTGRLAFADVLSPLNQSQEDHLLREGHKARVILPLFSQLFSFYLPKGFHAVAKKTVRNTFSMMFIPENETFGHASQTLTLVGGKNLAVEMPNMTPRGFAEMIAKKIDGLCPSSFSKLPLPGGLVIPGWDCWALVAGCGNDSNGSETFQETTLIIVIKGERDFYNLEWNIKGPPSDGPVKLTKGAWLRRLDSLKPIKLCPVLPGEQPPFPSCDDDVKI